MPTDIAQRWESQRKITVAERRLAGMSLEAAENSLQRLTFDAIDVSFDAIADPKERDYFMNLPASLTLPAEAVERLRGRGGRLFRESKTTQSWLRDDFK